MRFSIDQESRQIQKAGRILKDKLNLLEPENNRLCPAPQLSMTACLYNIKTVKMELGVWLFSRALV